MKPSKTSRQKKYPQDVANRKKTAVKKAVKPVSAQAAAAKGRSAVAHVARHAFRDIDFLHTGTNPTYGEDEE